VPTKRFDNVNPERKRKILDAARREFVRRGFESASLNEIVKEAEISKGSLYYYFEDKTDLFLTVFDHLSESVVRKFEEIASGESAGDFWEDFEDFCRWKIRFAFDNPDFVRLGRELLHLSLTRGMEGTVGDFFEKRGDVLIGVLSRGRELGEVRDDIPIDLLASIFYHIGEAVTLWMIERWQRLSQEEIDRLTVVYTEVCRRSLGADG